MNRQELARTALRCALECRRLAQSALDAPVCVYDLAERAGAEVWFFGGASFAGMYAKDFGRIFVPAERPAGRRSFTCAHELGHHVFGHGSRVEELNFDRSDNDIPEEVLANTFAAFLLMPRQAVTHAFRRRGMASQNVSPQDLYRVSSQLGVGYDTLVTHMRWSLNLIDHARMRDLTAVQPKEVRRRLLGTVRSGHLVLADDQWEKVAIDLEVGDHAIVPAHAEIRGGSVRVIGDCGSGVVLEALRPGISQAQSQQNDWASMIRVSRKQFVGRAAYRNLEDPDCE